MAEHKEVVEAKVKVTIEYQTKLERRNLLREVRDALATNEAKVTVNGRFTPTSARIVIKTDE